MDEARRLGGRIRRMRKRLGLTQDELAERAGISLQHMGDMERGGANPTFSCLVRLAGALDADVEDLFERDDSPPDEAAMRDLLIRHIGGVDEKRLAAFYMLYRGSR